MPAIPEAAATRIIETAATVAASGTVTTAEEIPVPVAAPAMAARVEVPIPFDTPAAPIVAPVAAGPAAVSVSPGGAASNSGVNSTMIFSSLSSSHEASISLAAYIVKITKALLDPLGELTMNLARSIEWCRQSSSQDIRSRNRKLIWRVAKLWSYYLANFHGSDCCRIRIGQYPTCEMDEALADEDQSPIQPGQLASASRTCFSNGKPMTALKKFTCFRTSMFPGRTSVRYCLSRLR